MMEEFTITFKSRYEFVRFLSVSFFSIFAIFLFRGFGHFLAIFFCVLLDRGIQREWRLKSIIGPILLHSTWLIPLSIFLILSSFGYPVWVEESVLKISNSGLVISPIDKILAAFYAGGSELADPFTQIIQIHIEYKPAYISLGAASIVGAILFSIALPLYSRNSSNWVNNYSGCRADVNNGKIRTALLFPALLFLWVFWISTSALYFWGMSRGLQHSLYPLLFSFDLWFFSLLACRLLVRIWAE
jgi:hypothetical protein